LSYIPPFLISDALIFDHRNDEERRENDQCQNKECDQKFADPKKKSDDLSDHASLVSPSQPIMILQSEQGKLQQGWIYLAILSYCLLRSVGSGV
jgi:hypothetical protein